MPAIRLALRWFAILIALVLSSYSPTPAQTMSWEEKNKTVEAMLKMGQSWDAIDLAREAWAEAEHFAPTDPRVAISLRNLALVMEATYAYYAFEETERLYGERIKRLETQFGGEHPVLLQALEHHADILYQRALGMEASLPDPEPAGPESTSPVGRGPHDFLPGVPDVPDTEYFGRAPAYGGRDSELATPIEASWNFSFYTIRRKAERPLRRVIAIREKTKGKSDPSLVWSLTCLADLYRISSLHKKAEPLFLRALAIEEAKKTHDPESYSTLLRQLGRLHFARRNYPLAEGYYDRAMQALDACAESDPCLNLKLSVLDRLAELYGTRKQSADLERTYGDALRLLDSHFPADDEQAQMVRSEWLALYRHLLRFEEAKQRERLKRAQIPPRE